MQFCGLREPRLDSPEIEIVTVDGQVIDLYNSSFFHSVVRYRDELAFEFESWPNRSMRTVLRFVGVRDLCVIQPDNWHPGEAEQIEDFMVRTPGPWKRVVFNAGGLEYEFNAEELHVVTNGGHYSGPSGGELKSDG